MSCRHEEQRSTNCIAERCDNRHCIANTIPTCEKCIGERCGYAWPQPDAHGIDDEDIGRGDRRPHARGGNLLQHAGRGAHHGGSGFSVWPNRVCGLDCSSCCEIVMGLRQQVLAANGYDCRYSILNFCRPNCPPGRRTKPENRLSFTNEVSAKKEGYRACLVCLPTEGEPGPWRPRKRY